MPIRFRCSYCNQLLGIAHRKAGTVVRCPTCAGQVVVPDPGAPAAQRAAPENAAAPLFERSDFDDVFAGAERRPEPHDPKDRVRAPTSLPEFQFPPAAPPVPAPPPPPPVPPGYDVERISLVPAAAAGPVATPGIVLSPTRATLLTVAALVAMGVAFTAGLLVGSLLQR